jgi:hypothetical protein
MGGKRMAKRVGADFSLDCRELKVFIDNPLHRAGSEPFPSKIQKNSIPLNFTFIDFWPGPDVQSQAFLSLPSKRNDSLLFPFSPDPN